MELFLAYSENKQNVISMKVPCYITGTRIPDPPFSSFGPSRDYGMDLCLNKGFSTKQKIVIFRIDFKEEQA
jgi:hypothetical protein